MTLASRAPAVPGSDSVGGPVVLAPGGGELITGGEVHARILITHDHPAYASTFEMTVAPGFDVGAHVHGNGEEMFYVMTGVLDIMCMVPIDRSGDWHDWKAADGSTWARGESGAFMYVPPGIPHAFANNGDDPVVIFFQSSVAGGHENYFRELGTLLGTSQGHPDPAEVKALEARYGTEQLTRMKS